jgi:diguanylate cyclase (GGDEF)-like protein
MSDAPLDPRLAAFLGPLVEAMAQRDGDHLLVLDPASGEHLHADPAVLPWLDGAGAAARSADQAAALQPGPLAAEHKLELAGTRREVSALRQRVAGPDGRWLVASVWRDLTPQRQREAQLRTALEQLEQEQLANEQLRKAAEGASPRDSASGLFNRAHFDDQLRREVDLSTREHREFALVAIEIDPPADSGPQRDAAAAARVLEALGRLLRGNTRAMDASCRWGEHCFNVLLSGVGLATAHSRMEGLRRQCATQIVALDGQELHFTVSMGVASFPHTAHTQDELRAACDAALAEARQRGGNRVTLASIRFDTA